MDVGPEQDKEGNDLGIALLSGLARIAAKEVDDDLLSGRDSVAPVAQAESHFLVQPQGVTPQQWLVAIAIAQGAPLVRALTPLVLVLGLIALYLIQALR